MEIKQPKCDRQFIVMTFYSINYRVYIKTHPSHHCTFEEIKINIRATMHVYGVKGGVFGASKN